MSRGLAPMFGCALAGVAVTLVLAGALSAAQAQAPDAAAGIEASPVPSDAAAPAKPTPPPPAEAKPEDRLPQNVEQVEPNVAVAVLGKKVRDASGKDMGVVVDVLVDGDGMVRAAVIDFGGFLGVGSRKIAIDRRLLQFNPTDRDTPIVLALDRAEVQAAPEYKPSPQPLLVVGPAPVPAEGRSTPPAEK